MNLGTHFSESTNVNILLILFCKQLKYRYKILKGFHRNLGHLKFQIDSLFLKEFGYHFESEYQEVFD